MRSGPRLILTTRGISTPELKTRFSAMMEAAHAAGPLTVAVVTTAMVCPQLSKLRAADGSSSMELALAERREVAAAASKALVAEAGLSDDANLLLIDAAVDQPAEMEDALARSSCIFVLGGNTFFLMHHMRRSGLDALVRRRVDEGAVYVGMSAGSIIAGRSVATAFWKGVRAAPLCTSRTTGQSRALISPDSPAAVLLTRVLGVSETVSQWDDPRVCECDWTPPGAVDGLGLVPDRSFFPHYEETWRDLVATHSPSLDHEVTTLSQYGGAFVVDGPAPAVHLQLRCEADEVTQSEPDRATTPAAAIDAWKWLSGVAERPPPQFEPQSPAAAVQAAIAAAGTGLALPNLA